MVSLCQSPVLRFIISILFFCAVTVSALPQPNPQHHKTVTLRADVPVTLASDPAPNDISTDFDSFLEQGSKLLKSLFGSFLRWGQNGGNGGAISTTIKVAPTQVEASNGEIVRTVYVTVYPSHGGHRPSRSRAVSTITGSAAPVAASELTVFVTISSEVLETAKSALSSSVPAVSGINDSSATISYATALPLSDYGPGLPTFILMPSDSIPSRSIYSVWSVHSTGRWLNSTRSGVTGPTGTGAPLATGTGIPSGEQNTTIVLHSKSTTTVYITLPYMWSNFTVAKPTATGVGSGEETNTTTVMNYTRTTVKYITRTVKPFPVTAIPTVIPATLIPESNISITIPPYLNSSSSTSPSSYPITAATTSPSEIPILIPGPTISSNATYGTLAALRRFCTLPNPQRAPLTLPLLSHFYGPSAYPVLNPFPGCSPPNPSQSLRAPGLLNCTLLGIEVQRCQQNGRRVLLSIKGSSVTEVGGNFDYGTPGQAAQPFGSYFGEDTGEVEGGGDGNGTNRKQHPDLFDPTHLPKSLALTLSSLFGETKTERADLRPLGPDPLAPGINWITRPLGEEVVVDGFDVQIPREWKGTVQGGLFEDFVQRLRELNDESWADSGATKGGKNDLGVDGKGIVLVGWL